MDASHIAAARDLLGLPERFTREELLRAYHRKLFEIHPDTAGADEGERDADTIARDAGELVPSIIAARETLEKSLEGGAPSPERKNDAVGAASTDSRGPGDFREPGKDGYEWYRRAMAIHGDALDEYWRERVKWSSLPEDSPVLEEFREKLRLAKVLFGRVLDRFPGGMWTADAVEKIAAINTWLGS